MLEAVGGRTPRCSGAYSPAWEPAQSRSSCPARPRPSLSPDRRLGTWRAEWLIGGGLSSPRGLASCKASLAADYGSEPSGLVRWSELHSRPLAHPDAYVILRLGCGGGLSRERTQGYEEKDAMLRVAVPAKSGLYLDRLLPSPARCRQTRQKRLASATLFSAPRTIIFPSSPAAPTSHSVDSSAPHRSWNRSADSSLCQTSRL